MKRKKKGLIKTIITMAVLGCVIVGVFAYVTNREDKEKAEQAVVENDVDKLLRKDLNTEYPPTAREVVKLYSRILKCIHSEELTEEQVEALADMELVLYDKELLDENPRDEYLKKLNDEIQEYKDNSMTVTAYMVEAANNIVTWKEDGSDYARTYAAYTVQEGAAIKKTYEEFVLRRNEAGQWKIVGWRLAEKEDTL